MVFTIGECLLDIVFRNGQPEWSCPGGSMLNTAVSLGRFGQPVAFISETG
ncbi:MAG TPA: carbohydrate kinase, partial [Lentimicrobium sp.]|nr:carbohydrate kinase [Lentimicrobium sp.]